MCHVGERLENRPVILTGYGHFQPVVDALPILRKIGINVIQIELGPGSVVLENGVDTSRIEEVLIPALDRAHANGVYVCLLVSPHIFPQWAFEKWPEIHVDNGFVKNTVEAPQVRAIYSRYLRTLIPMIEDHPALQSICLSNEPQSIGSPDDPFRLPLWREYLARKHGSVEKVNALYGTNYGDFEEIPHPRFDSSESPGVLYDAIRFNQERFAGWHEWMADIVHELAPGLPCHAKVQALPDTAKSLFWGTHPFEFAMLSQINGNDCTFGPNHPEPPWESSWVVQNMYYDLQRSMKCVPVFNSENHVINDREEGYVNPNHIYTAIWQGALHGQGGSTTWAWHRTYNRASDFEGLILHRAACTAAMSRCALDLMRLSREVAALANVIPRVAILYSHAAMIRDKSHMETRKHVYEALNFCGVPIGFIPDEQFSMGSLKEYDCLIVPGAKAATGDAIEGIRRRLEKGGHVVAYGPGNLAVDEYGRDVDPLPFTATLEVTRHENLRDALSLELVKAGVRPEMDLRTGGGEVPYGVEWRTAPFDGHRLANLIDLTRDPMRVELPEGTWSDLITGKTLSSPVNLKPNVPVLITSRLIHRSER